MIGKVIFLVCGILIAGCSSSQVRYSRHSKLLSTIQFSYDEFNENFNKGKALVFLNELLKKHQSGSDKLLIKINKRSETLGYGVNGNENAHCEDVGKNKCNNGAPVVSKQGDFYINIEEALNCVCAVTSSGWRIKDNEIIIFSRLEDPEWVPKRSDFMEGVEP